MVDCEFEVREMMVCAHNHIRSVNLLKSRVGDFGGSATHLAVLAFEIALKAVHLSATGKRANSHDYWSIWENLPKETRGQIMCRAIERNAGHVDLSDMQAVLDGLQTVFTRGRYDYEFIQGLTASEAAEKGRRWVEKGAKLEDADICYLPMERDGLTFGLFKWIEKKHGFKVDFDE